MTTPGIFFEPDWPAPRNVPLSAILAHRRPEVGAYASLNLGARVGDDGRAVEENRAVLKRSLALPADPLWLEQVHGTTVIDADSAGGGWGCRVARPDPASFAPFKRRYCLPVLSPTTAGSHIAAAHAGWRDSRPVCSKRPWQAWQCRRPN